MPGDGEYYDETALSCMRCNSGTQATSMSSLLVADDTSVDAVGLPTTCTCKANSVWASQDDAVCSSTWPAPCRTTSCVTCPASTVPTDDKLQCLPCGNSTLGVDSNTGDCRCPANAVLRERSERTQRTRRMAAIWQQKNVSSALTTRSVTNNTNDPAMTTSTAPDGSVSCTCPSGFQLVKSLRLGRQTCLSQSEWYILNAKVNLNTASTMKYGAFSSQEASGSDSAVVVSSDLVQDTFLTAASQCYFYESEQQNVYCQLLGNLCVLTHFDPRSSACSLLDLIQRSGRSTTVNSIFGWYRSLPFLAFQATASAVLKATSIGMRMSFDESANSGTSDHLEFALATYDVNGTLTSIRPLANDLLYCQLAQPPTSSDAVAPWMRFGVSTFQLYQCDLTALDGSHLVMYELFLVDRSKDANAPDRYVPVPTRNVNYQDARGLSVNVNERPSDTDNDYLTHRFFLYDFVSAVAVAETKPRVYRYASAITVTIKTQDASVDRLYPPVITITYVDTQTPRAVPLTFQVVYASNTTSFWAAAIGLFVAACVFTALSVCVQTFSWQRRNTRNGELSIASWQLLAHLITCAASTFARAGFWLLVALCAYFLLFFKLQSTVFLLLPEVVDTDALQHSASAAAAIDEYYPFRVLLPVVFAFQLLSVLWQVYHQTQAQLFFLDWEKPRAKIVDLDSAKTQDAPVSIWRTILVANEWNELQTARLTSLRFTLVLMLFFLYGCDLRQLATPVPRAQLRHTGTAASLTTDESLALNAYLRFANVAWLWLAVCIAQRLWRWLIYERYLDEPRASLFIDLCTVAKVSCLVLDEPYHGYYLHCRSPYPFADGSMSEIVDQLRQEEAGLTVGRGLDSSLPDCQTFEVFVTRKWKRKFQTLATSMQMADGPGVANGNAGESTELLKRPMAALRGRPQLGSLNAGWSLANSIGNRATRTTQEMVKKAMQLSDFLKAFVENQDEQFRWRLHRLHTCLTRFFDIPPDMTAVKQSLLVPDTDMRFTRTILCGIENDLMLLDVLCFGVFDLWFQNHASSALATYLLEKVIVGLRSRYGSQSIARNTLVDARFLI
ncbi:TPA: hypothetical protein N0F65_007235 [Lagenidium giganteum]|uniref:Meckelin n=1 Tax=Lagenidium giganteum TaxID=4803 RepID=A0AAV2Z7Y3_9STRA|nr:TPA: hypothetical protein N0F65_007235 [Lagenidium giganteum]